MALRKHKCQKDNGPRTMSDQPTSSIQNQASGAKLVNQYKPVGIAALNAATVCQQFKTQKKPS